MSLPLQYPYNAIIIIIGIGLILLYLHLLFKRREIKKLQDFKFTVKGKPISHIQLFVEGIEPFNLNSCIITDNRDGTHTILIVGAYKK